MENYANFPSVIDRTSVVPRARSRHLLQSGASSPEKIAEIIVNLIEFFGDIAKIIAGLYSRTYKETPLRGGCPHLRSITALETNELYGLVLFI